MNVYSAFPKAPALLDAHHQIILNHIIRALVRGDSICVFYRPSQLDWKKKRNSGFLVYVSQFYIFFGPTWFLCEYTLREDLKKKKILLMSLYTLNISCLFRICISFILFLFSIYISLLTFLIFWSSQIETRIILFSYLLIIFLVFIFISFFFFTFSPLQTATTTQIRY